MSDDLVKRLRAGCLPMKHDAADLIEAQAAEIEAYRRGLYLKQTLISDQAAEIERLQREVQKQRSLRDQYRAAWEDEKGSGPRHRTLD